MEQTLIPLKSRLLESFAASLSTEGLANNSVQSYISQVKGYLQYLEGKGIDPASATREHILAYFDEKRRSGHKRNSIFFAALAVKKFHRLLCQSGRRPTDPSIGIRIKKSKPRLPQPLTLPEIDKLLRPPVRADFESIRNQAIFQAMYATGIRVSELTGLNLSDVHLEKGWLRVIGKGDKERWVPIGPKAKKTLRRYLEARKKKHPSVTDALFLNVKGTRMGRGGVWLILGRKAKESGISGRVHPHRIRHSTITHLLAGGANLRVLQEFAGHESVLTTQNYAHVMPELLRKTCEAAHPRF